METNAAPVTGRVVAGLTPGEKRHLKALENRIERGLRTFRDVGEALMDIRDNRLYRETHANFESYCRERWGLERGRAYQLIGAVEVVQAIGEGAEELMNEAQARELVALVHEDPALVQEVWQEVTSGDEPVTAPRIREVVQRHMRPKETPSVSETTRLLEAISRLSSLYEKWSAGKPSQQDRVTVRAALQDLFKVIT